MYTRVQTNTHYLLRELSGPRPLCRAMDIVSKPHIWNHSTGAVSFECWPPSEIQGSGRAAIPATSIQLVPMSSPYPGHDPLPFFYFFGNFFLPRDGGRITCGGGVHLRDSDPSQIVPPFSSQTETDCADERTRSEWIQGHCHRDPWCGFISYLPSYLISPKALQGAFLEHRSMLQKLSLHVEISVSLVRSVQDLQTCDALIIPGGGMPLTSRLPLPIFSFHLAESTTIALLAKLSGLLDPLREFLKSKPVWGSCAGAVLMSRNVINAKKGGQDLLGGLSVTTARNGWGSQVGDRFGFAVPPSFTIDYSFRSNPLRLRSSYNRCPNRIDRSKGSSFALQYYPHLSSLNHKLNSHQVVLSVDSALGDPPLQVIARVPVEVLPGAQHLVPGGQDLTDPLNPRTIVAFRQGDHLFTSFHPELTKDDRFHAYFIQECVLTSLATSRSSTSVAH